MNDNDARVIPFYELPHRAAILRRQVVESVRRVHDGAHVADADDYEVIECPWFVARVCLGIGCAVLALMLLGALVGG